MWLVIAVLDSTGPPHWEGLCPKAEERTAFYLTIGYV